MGRFYSLQACSHKLWGSFCHFTPKDITVWYLNNTEKKLSKNLDQKILENIIHPIPIFKNNNFDTKENNK